MHPIHPALRNTARVCTILLPAALTASAFAQAGLHGHVRDPLGALVPGAKVYLVSEHDTKTILDATTSAADGTYALTIPSGSRYRVGATATSFRETLTASVYLTPEHADTLDITLRTPTRSDEVTVTATGTPTPLAQSGAPITILTQEADYPHALEMQEPLRLVPGVQITASGQTGAQSSLFLRGGDSNFTKVLIDGVPVNDIGALADLSTLATTGIARAEVLRQPSSVLYGSDALSGVVSLSSARGTTPLPLFTYAVDGGNLGQLRQEGSIAGAYRLFDYDAGLSASQTSNNQPNDQDHNSTSFGNFGYAPDARTDVRFTFRHIDTNSGNPNAIALYGIPDFINQFYKETFLNGTAQQQTTPRWHNLLRYGWQGLNYTRIQYAPNGPFDPNSGETLGNVVTLHGANGYSSTGQALLDYVGFPPFDTQFPSQSDSTTRRSFIYAQTDYNLTNHLNALGSFKYEAEDGKSAYSSARRGNYSYTLQLAGDAGSRFHYVIGSGIEDNALYGKALTPRASAAYYAIRPNAARFLSGTKLHASFGKGVQEPTVGDQIYSLFGAFSALPNGASLIAQYGTRPLGGEYSRTYDAGVEQQFGDGRARVNLSYFHNQFTNVLEYVNPNGLVLLGIPAAEANDPNLFGAGAYVNSLAERAQGLELESEYRINRHLFARAGYTWLDAVVERSFSSDGLGPSFNDTSSFATIPIGNFGPLVGARPFRRAPHTGYFALQYTHSRFNGQLSGSLVGRRDDSTFLGGSDVNFGNSLLLPNRNLDGSYQRLQLSADYRITAHLTTYANLQNLLNQSYFEAYGYPALPFTARGGLRFTFGGESFRIN